MQNGQVLGEERQQVTSSDAGGSLNSQEQVPVESGSGNATQLFGNAQEISTELANFSRLSSELTGFISRISERVQEWITLHNQIQSEIELKKNELKRLHNIEASAITLEQMIEEQRLRKENFENLMENQRRLWEEEKAQRLQQEREYFENLRLQRQREEEEYRKQLEIERQQARQQLDAELQALREESRLKFEERERDLARWESILKEKESELDRLVHELEQIMSSAADRLQSLTAAGLNPRTS